MLIKNIQRIFQPFLIILVLVFVSTAVFAKGSELEFKAAIAEINQPAEGDSTVTVSLFSESTDFDITIIVDTNTKIESNGNDIDLSELEIGDYIKVSAFFSDAGIVAEEIDLLGGRIGQFCLRGLIDGVSSSGDGTLVDLLGVSVLDNSATRIRDRSRNEDGTIDSLIVGELIDTKGRVVDDVFVARRIMLGQRREGHVEFDGEITQIDSNLLAVVTHNDTILGAVIDGETRIRGDLLVGVYVEVDGFLNEQLQVVADKIKVDGNGDGSVDFGSLTTNDRGRVEIEFKDSPKSGQVQINNLLPDGKDVRDIQQVQITLDGSPVLEASF